MTTTSQDQTEQYIKQYREINDKLVDLNIRSKAIDDEKTEIISSRNDLLEQRKYMRAIIDHHIETGLDIMQCVMLAADGQIDMPPKFSLSTSGIDPYSLKNILSSQSIQNGIFTAPGSIYTAPGSIYSEPTATSITPPVYYNFNNSTGQIVWTETDIGCGTIPIGNYGNITP